MDNRAPAHIEWWFLGLFLFFGSLFLFLTPPFQVPDEPNHLYRAYQVSEGRLLAELRDGQSGGTLPANLVNTAKRWKRSLAHQPGRRVNRDLLHRGFRIALDAEHTVFVGFFNTAIYNPLIYLPQASAIALGRLFDASPLVLLYLARLAGFGFAAAMLTLALRVTPVLKRAFMLVMLTPQMVFMLASASGDVMVICLSFLAAAVVLRLAAIDGREAGRTHLAALFVILPLLALCKFAYAPFVLLYLAIPARNVGGRRRYLLVGALLLLVSGAFALAWGRLAVSFFTPPEVERMVQAQAHMQFIVGHPFEYAVLLVRTVREHGLQMLCSFLGVLGWLDTEIPLAVLAAYGLMIVFVALGDGNGRVSGRCRLVASGVAVACAVLVATLLFLYYTSLSETVVEGLQGRYFIPVAPLLLTTLHNRRLRNVLSESGWLAVMVSLVVLTLSCALYALCQRYYG